MSRTILCGALLLLGARPLAQAQTNSSVTVYSTRFETAEGYDPNLPLAGQTGWKYEGSGGNGFLSAWPNFGLQAFIGYTAPDNNGDFLDVWRPVNYAPIDPNHPILKFSALMQIMPSTNGHADDFRWSCYNTNSDRLFSIDFDNEAMAINYVLDDNQFVSTGQGFNHGMYQLDIYMNFVRNHWTALLDGMVMVNAQPITTRGSRLNFGDMDAVWVIHTPGHAGNNYMIFDNFQITREPELSIPPSLYALGLTNGAFNFRFFGEPLLTYSIDVSTNLTDWLQLGAYDSGANGVFDFNDPSAGQFDRSFYRAETPPANKGAGP